MRSLEFRDRILVLQREADVVEAVQQLVSPERIDVEGDRRAVCDRDRLRLEIDGRLGGVAQLPDLLLGQRDREQPDLRVGDRRRRRLTELRGAFLSRPRK